jgi:hypothetical protein
LQQNIVLEYEQKADAESRDHDGGYEYNLLLHIKQFLASFMFNSEFLRPHQIRQSQFIAEYDLECKEHQQPNCRVPSIAQPSLQ